MFDGKELIEEGVGFGVPVLKYKDKTYFSSSAQSFLFYDEKKQPILTKSFNFDAISRKRLGSNSYVNDALYRLIHRVFEKAYLGYKGLAPAMNAIMELRTRLKIQTDFIKVESRGTVDVAYTCRPDAIEVSVDFSEAKKEDCCEILILNEQGASSFSEYSDTDGLSLSGRGIGAWEEVNAQEATLSDKEGRLGFTLRKTETAELFRGWERTRGRFSWSGLSYSLPPSVSTFNFVVELNEPP